MYSTEQPERQVPADQDQRAVSGRQLLLALGIAVVLLGATTLFLSLVAVRGLGMSGAHARAVFLVAAYVALLVGLLVAFGGPGGLARDLRFRFTSFKDLMLALGLWLVALAVGTVVTAALTPLLGRPESNAVALLRLARDPLFVGLVLPTLVLLAPATEEMLFRGGLLGWLAGRLPFAAAALITALVFAAAHLILTAFVFLFLFGLAAAYVVRRTGSTFNSFVMHACQNTVAVAAAYAVLQARPTS